MLTTELDQLKDHLKSLNQQKERLKQQRLNINDKVEKKHLKLELMKISQQTKKLKVLIKDLNIDQKIKRQKTTNYSIENNFKYELRKTLPQLIFDRQDYCPFFVTVTFTKQNAKREAYDEFMRFFQNKVTRELLSNRRETALRPIFFDIPEYEPMLHYHGFMLIHQEKRDRFIERCVENIILLPVEALDNLEKDHFYLKDNILKPYHKAQIVPKDVPYTNPFLPKDSPEQIYFDIKKKKPKPDKTLKIRKCHIVELPQNSDEIYKVSNYITKSFINNPLVTFDDFMINTRNKPERIQGTRLEIAHYQTNRAKLLKDLPPIAFIN